MVNLELDFEVLFLLLQCLELLTHNQATCLILTVVVVVDARCLWNTSPWPNYISEYTIMSMTNGIRLAEVAGLGVR